MMEMQDATPRRRERAAVDAGAADATHVQEIDPDVPADAPLMGAARKKQSSIERGVRYVVDRFWPAVFFTLAALGIYELQFVHEVLYAPHANRVFVNLSLLCSTLVMLFGSYIEIYRNLFLGEKVSYEKAKTSTHGMLLSMVLAGVCFTIGMWPVWHWLTLPYLFMWFWGIIVQIVVLFPVQLQRVIFGVGYLWFMHSYLSLFVV